MIKCGCSANHEQVPPAHQDRNHLSHCGVYSIRSRSLDHRKFSGRFFGP